LKRGIIKNTPNYPFNQIPIVEPLRKQFGVPTIIVNDCSAAVQGERVFGAGVGLDNLFYVTLSTGIGGGAIVDGHLLFGKDGNAPEIGHITIYHCSELICGCGGKGHWEAYAGGKNIPNFARVLISRMNWEGSLLYEICNGKLVNIHTKTIFDLSKQKDQLSMNIVEEIGKINAVGFSNIINTFDPELITVGGSVALNNPGLILNPILKGVDQYIINRKPEIIITPLGGDAVLTGALALSLCAHQRPSES
jgi:glucokinase